MQLGKHQLGAVLLQRDEHIDAGMSRQPVIRLNVKALPAQNSLNCAYDLLGSLHNDRPFLFHKLSYYIPCSAVNAMQEKRGQSARRQFFEFFLRLLYKGEVRIVR